MRNLFDQYHGPENRLTHALASCLWEDRRLLREFIQSFKPADLPSPPRHLDVLEQQVPGKREVSEEEADELGERGGLPDMWIHDNESWALLVEAKVNLPLRRNQLDRHLKTAHARGYETVGLLAITVKAPSAALPESSRQIDWSNVYRWARKRRGRSEWAARLAAYLEAAEARMIENKCLTDGTLTEFTGIPFWSENPYHYPEAKRVLKLAMRELRDRKDLQQELGMDPAGSGRGMIKQGDGHHVWDFLRIQPNQKQNRRQKPEKFTQYPHLTLAVGDDAVLPIVVLPNGMKGKFRRNLLDLRMEGFLELIRKVEKNLCARLGTVKGCMPWFIALQRRSIRMVEESTLQFDLRTALPKQGKWLGGEVRYQLEWIRAAWKAFENKKHSNIELDIGARFSYDKCRGRLNRRDALDLFAGTWLACKPILDTALQGV